VGSLDWLKSLGERGVEELQFPDLNLDIRVPLVGCRRLMQLKRDGLDRVSETQRMSADEEIVEKSRHSSLVGYEFHMKRAIHVFVTSRREREVMWDRIP
jgi:hypothetical protein